MRDAAALEQLEEIELDGCRFHLAVGVQQAFRAPGRGDRARGIVRGDRP